MTSHSFRTSILDGEHHPPDLCGPAFLVVEQELEKRDALE
jgi:hypothetical protein